MKLSFKWQPLSDEFLCLHFPASRGLSRRGKHERKERVSLLSLMFASSWETSASRECLHLVRVSITWDQAFFFASLLLWLEREKNNAWYIYLTSSQPPPNLHNLTSAWPVMLLANKRLPYGNQILARIMSLLKSILGKRKFLSTSMFRWRFLKKNLNVLFLWWNTASWSCRTFI